MRPPGQTASENERRDDDHIDAQLLERVIGRDREALTELYRRYYQPLLRFIQRITGDIDAAQEGINDVMLVVWNSASSFGGRSRVRTWIMGIAYRKALKLLQKSRTWRSRFKAADWEESIEPVAASSEHTRDLGLEDLLYRGIRALSPKHRAVVELTYFHGCSYEEIAAIVDCPVNTVKTRMFHARVKLRELLPELSRDDIDT